MYEAIYYGDGNLEAISEKNVLYSSRESFNMEVCVMLIPLLKKFTV
jgi:hypothetical protein